MPESLAFSRAAAGVLPLDVLRGLLAGAVLSRLQVAEIQT